MARRKHGVVGGSYQPDHAFRQWTKRHRFTEHRPGKGGTACTSCHTSLDAKKKAYVRTDPDETLCEECARRRRKASVATLTSTPTQRTVTKPKVEKEEFKKDNTAGNKTKKSATSHRKVSKDALDHRLPGSYGTGKRR
jgi:predicted CXXCH cytochrome family protein